MQYHLGGPTPEKAQHPSRQVGREAAAAKEEVELVVPQVVEGAGEVQERGGRSSATVEVVHLAGGLDKSLVVEVIPGPVRGVHQSGQRIFGTVAAAEAVLTGIEAAGGVRSDSGCHQALGHFGHH